MKNKTSDAKILSIWMRFQPISTDPLKYDLDVHHMTMRSVYASLVSLYGNGKITPQVAKSWQSSTDQKIWTVYLDPDWKFSNGDIITPKIVADNFKRIICLKKKIDSNSGLFEYLKGYEKINKITDDVEGISIKENQMIFSFVKPMPNFLEKISFGFYGIAHPSQYDHQSGKWLNDKEAISSGHYVISTWNNDKFELKLREDSPLFNNPKAVRNVIFNFSQDTNEILKSDIIFREKFNYLIDEEEWSFASTLEDSNIVYVKVMKWNNPKSPFFNIELRKHLREIFYNNLSKAGYTAVKSFFPTSIKGVHELAYNEDKWQSVEIKSLTMPPFFKPLKSERNKSKKDLGEIYKDGFEAMCRELGIQPRYADYPEKESDEEKLFDLQYLGTGIDINDPDEDIKFMFFSKHGIKLPDSNGNIGKLLTGEKINVQLINEELWNQAIIWPIRHYSQGFWIKNSSSLITSKLNLSLNPIDFQFLEWN